MKRTILNAQQAAWLTTTIDRNRSLFGGLQMMADDDGDKAGGAGGDAGGADKGAAADDQKSDAKTDSKAADQALGEGGKKAIESERAARKAAEEQAKALKGEFDTFKKAMTEALGVKTKDGDKEQDALTAIQEQLAAMQRESSVLKLANEHKITDAKDLELLATAKDADSMKRLAERLAPKEQDGDAKSSRKPKPDRGQGGSGGSGVKSVAQVMADRAAARAAKTQS